MAPTPDRELKKGNAELMILALLEHQPRHGLRNRETYRRNALKAWSVSTSLRSTFRCTASNAAVGCSGEGAWSAGVAVSFYRLTASGRKTLAYRSHPLASFSRAVNRIAEVRYA